MTVVVQCFHCNAILELDEGFRGGVCRCSACGSLLQVPKAQDAAGAPTKKVRPDIPPAPTRRATPPSGSPADPDGFLRSPTGSPGFGSDYGGSSSGLGRVHKTRPVAGPSSRKIIAAHDNAPAESLAPGNAPPPPPRLPAHGLPEIRAARHNSLLFWTGIVLILIIAAVAVTLVFLYLTRQDPRRLPISRTVLTPVVVPATGPQESLSAESSPVQTPAP